MLPCHLMEGQLFWLWIETSLLHSSRFTGWGLIISLDRHVIDTFADV